MISAMAMAIVEKQGSSTVGDANESSASVGPMLRVQRPGARFARLPWSDLLVFDEPWLADALPFLTEVDLHTVVEELLQQPPRELMDVRVQFPVWQADEWLPVADESVETGCLGIVCPNFLQDTDVASTFSSVSSLLSEGLSTIVRVLSCAEQSVTTLHSSRPLGLQSPTACTMAGSHSMRNLTRVLSNAVAIGAVQELRPTSLVAHDFLSTIKRSNRTHAVGAWSADVYLTSAGDNAISSIAHGWHTDFCDGLILMLNGSKRFRVASPVVGGPLLFDVQLRAGQALFVPRGFFHLGGTDANAEDSALISVSLGGYFVPTFDDLVTLTQGKREEDQAFTHCFGALDASRQEQRRCRDWAWAATTLGMAQLRSWGVPDYLLVDSA